MPVKAGALIELAPKPLPHEGPLRIHYEDRFIVVIEKPSGLLSVAKETGEDPSVHAWMKHRYPGRVIPVVHRLDQDTSGLMVFGLTSEAFTNLKDALQRGEVRRVYRAVVQGRLEGKGTWESYLLEDHYLKMQVVPKGTKGAERAVTHYTSLKVGETYSLIDCTLETGKKNQIRVQAAHAGHPLAGDKKYGGSTEDAGRLCLHAHTLTFAHPITGAQMTFSSPPPNFFERIALRRSRFPHTNRPQQQSAERGYKRAERKESGESHLIDKRSQSPRKLSSRADAPKDRGDRKSVESRGSERRSRRTEYWTKSKPRNNPSRSE
jgi:tRNA pseudouridine32 synthase/23S rRNA pseudouridine746 synthase/23S rRNA pseudouridine1911/1915/1917 synthase